MSNPTVSTFQFDVALDSPELVDEVQRRLSAFAGRRLPALLRECIDRCFGDSAEVTLDRLELDLGDLPLIRLEDELARRLRLALMDALSGRSGVAIAHSKSTAELLADSVRPVPSPPSAVDALRHRLLTGQFLPGDVRRGQPLGSVLMVSLGDDQESLLHMLRTVWRQGLARRRFLLQCDASVHDAVIRLAGGTDASRLISWIKDRPPAMASLARVSMDQHAFAEALRLSVLDILLSESPQTGVSFRAPPAAVTSVEEAMIDPQYAYGLGPVLAATERTLGLLPGTLLHGIAGVAAGLRTPEADGPASTPVRAAGTAPGSKPPLRADTEPMSSGEVLQVLVQALERWAREQQTKASEPRRQLRRSAAAQAAEATGVAPATQPPTARVASVNALVIWLKGVLVADRLLSSPSLSPASSPVSGSFASRLRWVESVLEHDSRAVADALRVNPARFRLARQLLTVLPIPTIDRLMPVLMGQASGFSVTLLRAAQRMNLSASAGPAAFLSALVIASADSELPRWLALTLDLWARRAKIPVTTLASTLRDTAEAGAQADERFTALVELLATAPFEPVADGSAQSAPTFSARFRHAPTSWRADTVTRPGLASIARDDPAGPAVEALLAHLQSARRVQTTPEDTEHQPRRPLSESLAELFMRSLLSEHPLILLQLEAMADGRAPVDPLLALLDQIPVERLLQFAAVDGLAPVLRRLIDYGDASEPGLAAARWKAAALFAVLAAVGGDVHASNSVETQLRPVLRNMARLSRSRDGALLRRLHSQARSDSSAAGNAMVALLSRLTAAGGSRGGADAPAGWEELSAVPPQALLTVPPTSFDKTPSTTGEPEVTTEDATEVTTEDSTEVTTERIGEVSIDTAIDTAMDAVIDRAMDTVIDRAMDTVIDRAMDAVIDTAIDTAIDAATDTVAHRLMINNAGLVLLWPFLSTYFERVGLLQAGAFAATAGQLRAVHLAQFLVDSRSDAPEHELALNKVLCGLDVAEPVAPHIAVLDQERDVAAGLNAAVRNQWPALKNTSAAGLQETFLQRQGRLERRPDAPQWSLVVRPGPFDMLLEQLPWSFSVIRLPWMHEALHVKWT